MPSPAGLYVPHPVSLLTLQHTSRKRRLYETFLSEVPILASLQPQERAKIADVLESRTFAEGEDVVRQGDQGEEFFLIEAGQAVAIKTQDGKESVVKQYHKGDYFGGEWTAKGVGCVAWSALLENSAA
jgi:cAMP-dependent protein kinase regulator